MKWIALCLILVSCAPVLTTVDYDDLYVRRHYNYQRRFNSYPYRESYLYPPAYYNYPWFYPQQDIIIQKFYTTPDQERPLTPGKRPDRESSPRTPSNSNRGTRRD